MKKYLPKNRFVLVMGLIMACCMGCSAISLITNSLRSAGYLPTYTPTPTQTSTPTATKTLTPSPTFTPSVTPKATKTPTVTPTLPPTNTAQATAVPLPTATKTAVATTRPTQAPQPTQAPLPTQAEPTEPSGPVCDCSGDRYSCTGNNAFGSQAAAQACFNYCISVGAGDVHRLDGDNDGLVCEN